MDNSNVPSSPITFGLQKNDVDENGVMETEFNNVFFESFTPNTAQNSHANSYQRTNPYRKKYTKSNCDDSFAKELQERLKISWVEETFCKRECIKFIPTKEDPNICCCGNFTSFHSQQALSRFTTTITSKSYQKHTPNKSWSIIEHTESSNTDAFGTLEFQGGNHAHKAQYCRVSYDANPKDIIHLMENIWKMETPKLIITVHGGMSDFNVQQKLGKVFREGLLKAAQTTGAWIITSGMDSGVVKHVAKALDDAGISARMRSKVVTIGIAPWGLLPLKDREHLIGKNIVVPYDHQSYSTKNRHTILNDRHSYFLLVDNGTVGRYGADMVLRKKFENYVSQEQKIGCGTRRVPIVCVMLEGGISTLGSILQYITSTPSCPVVVCDGSGRASDLLAFAQKNVSSKGCLSNELKIEMTAVIRKIFNADIITANEIYESILRCVQSKDSITVFRYGEEGSKDVDYAILTAILRNQTLSQLDQLSLTLAWNRVDICRSHIFIKGRDWPSYSLHSAMMDALILDRVDFVKLLLENGVNLKKFLTIEVLTTLYNIEKEEILSLRRAFGAKPNENSKKTKNITLHDVGVVIEKLMGNAYRCRYTFKSFLNKRDTKMKAQTSILNLWHQKIVNGGSKASFLGMVEGNGEVKRKSAYMSREMSNSIEVHDFDFPYNDLTLWVILTKRHEMAKFLWQYGEEAMARALIAIRLYKGMAKVAANDYTAVEASTILRTYADDFHNLSIELLEHAYQISYADTAALLTTELPNWGHHTSLSLAFLANNKQFLSSPCCQILLAELWHGGLRFKSQPNFKVIAGVLFPPTILLLDFKSSGSNLTKTVGPLKQKEVRLDVLDNINNTDGEHEDDDHYIPNAKGLEKKRRSVISLTYNSLFNDSQFALKRLFNMRHKQESTNIRSIETGNESNEIFMNDKTGQSTSKIGKKQADVDYDFGRAEDVNACKTIQTWMIILFYRFLLFYRAPITSFWIWTISFLTFLMSFTYVLLVELELSPTALEWYIFFYVVAVGLEHLRKLVTLESSSMMEKIRVYYNTYWNILTAGAVITYLIGFFLRLNPLIMHSHGRVVLACNSTLWHMKLFDFLSVHPKIGPYIKMAAKMILNMSYILIMLLVTLMAFGLTKQSITYPHEKWNWILVRNIFFKPYFMLYGEVFATEIDPCGDESFNCVPGHLIPIVVMVIFLLVANILLINMLIAIFNNIFIQTNAMSQQIWAFQRYSQVLEYENTPIIPPPFTTLIHLYLVCRAIILYLFCKLPDQSNQSGFRRVREIMPFAIKVKNASYDQLRQIHDYEEDCVDDLCRKKNHLIKVDVEESMSTYADRLEMMTGKVMELMNENEGLKAHLISVEDMMKSVGENQRCMMKLMLKNNRDRRVHERTSEADTESKVDSNYQLSPADLTSDAESDFDEILTRSRFNTSFRDNRTSTLPKLPHYTSITDGLASKLRYKQGRKLSLKNCYKDGRDQMCAGDFDEDVRGIKSSNYLNDINDMTSSKNGKSEHFIGCKPNQTQPIMSLPPANNKNMLRTVTENSSLTENE